MQLANEWRRQNSNPEVRLCSLWPRVNVTLLNCIQRQNNWCSPVYKHPHTRPTPTTLDRERIWWEEKTERLPTWNNKTGVTWSMFHWSYKNLHLRTIPNFPSWQKVLAQRRGESRLMRELAPWRHSYTVARGPPPQLQSDGDWRVPPPIPQTCKDTDASFTTSPLNTLTTGPLATTLSPMHSTCFILLSAGI